MVKSQQLGHNEHRGLRWTTARVNLGHGVPWHGDRKTWWLSTEDLCYLDTGTLHVGQQGLLFP